MENNNKSNDLHFIVKKKDKTFQLDGDAIPSEEDAIAEAKKRTIGNSHEYGVVKLIELFQKVETTKSILNNE